MMLFQTKNPSNSRNCIHPTDDLARWEKRRKEKETLHCNDFIKPNFESKQLQQPCIAIMLFQNKFLESKKLFHPTYDLATWEKENRKKFCSAIAYQEWFRVHLYNKSLSLYRTSPVQLQHSVDKITVSC